MMTQGSERICHSFVVEDNQGEMLGTIAGIIFVQMTFLALSAHWLPSQPKVLTFLFPFVKVLVDACLKVESGIRFKLNLE